MNDLTQKRCLPCEGGIKPLAKEQIAGMLEQIKGWEIDEKQQLIFRQFNFQSYAKVILFVNSVAWMAEQESHHPDLAVGYNKCRVSDSTHAIGGLSENDFICASKVNALWKDS